MPFENLPEYSDAELEKRASQFLAAQYGTVVRIPVDVDWLLTTLPGVDLDCYPGLAANYAIEGGVWRDTESGLLMVYIDERLMDDNTVRGITRYRTTVAEELAHLLIHRDVIEQVQGPDNFRELHNQILRTRVEKNAKRMAAALLMPKEQLWDEAAKEYQLQVQRRGTDEPESIKLLIWGVLAQRFKVSDVAMKYRLTELKIFDAVDEAAHRGRPRL
jgi:hypothetical protein